MKSLSSRRLIEYAAGIIILCIGVVSNTRTGLGVACINTIPYSMSCLTPLSLGTATFILYVVFIAAQLLIIRKLSVKILLQLPVSLLFGMLVDVINNAMEWKPDSPAGSYLLLVCAIALTALGTVLMIDAAIVPAAPDGMVQTISNILHWNFGKSKMFFDLLCVAFTAGYTAVLSGYPVGIGIGTLAAMCLTGTFCNIWRKILKSLFTFTHVKDVSE